VHQTSSAARAWADLGLLLVSAIWGATFVVIKDALQDASPYTFLALRFGLAALVLSPSLLLGRDRLAPGLLTGGAVGGLLLFAGYAFQTIGLQFTSASKAGFITGLSVVVVPLVSALVLRQRVSRSTTLGVALATVGLALLSLQDDLSLQMGDLIVLCSAIAFGLHVLVLGHFAPRHHPLPLVAAQISTAALLSAASAILFERPSLGQLTAILPAALFTGLLATAGAIVIQAVAQRFTTPVRTALVFTTEPIFAGLFAYLYAGEHLTPRALLGCAAILLGMLVAQASPPRSSASLRTATPRPKFLNRPAREPNADLDSKT
jgi:drug/metabolite transporter (DMT)-like permease